MASSWRVLSERERLCVHAVRSEHGGEPPKRALLGRRVQSAAPSATARRGPSARRVVCWRPVRHDGAQTPHLEPEHRTGSESSLTWSQTMFWPACGSPVSGLITQ
jgi:hypothetical protein